MLIEEMRLQIAGESAQSLKKQREMEKEIGQFKM